MVLSVGLLLGCDLLLLLSGEAVQQRLVDAGLEVAVVGSDDAVGIVDGNGPDIGKSLDLGRALLVLDVGHVEVKLLRTRLDGVPAGQTRCEVNVSRHAEIGGVDNLVGARVVQDGLGVDTGLVGEGTETGDVVVEGNVDLDGFGHEILNLLELMELVLALDIVAIGGHHTGHQTTERRDAVSLANTEDGGVDVGGSGLQSAVSVGNGAAGIIVQMNLNITMDDTTKDTDELVDLSGGGAANGIGDTDTVDTDLVDGRVDGKEVDEIGPEGVLGGESDFDTLGLDVLDDLDGGILDVGHVLAVGVLAEIRRGSDDDVTVDSVSINPAYFEMRCDSHSIDTRLDRNLRIVHVAANMCKNLSNCQFSRSSAVSIAATNLGLQSKLADSLAVLARLFRSAGAGKLDLNGSYISTTSASLLCHMTHVVNAKVIERPGDLDLLLGGEEGIGKLLALTEGALDDLESRDVAEEV